MAHSIIKVWKDADNRRWYLTDCDDYPYISSSTIVGIAKTYRYKDLKKDDKAKQRLQQAADRGIDIHSVLEWTNRANIEFGLNEVCSKTGHLPDPKLVVRYAQIINNYIDKVKLISLNDGEVKVIEVERSCINPIFKYAGRFDLLVTVGGEYEVWDYKTSKLIHEEDGWQLVSYMEALKLESIPVKRVRIIHIDKITSKITDLKYQHHEYMFDKFLCCLEVFKGLYFNDMLKGRINDLEELGKKYKWPINDLTNDSVIWYNQHKGDNNMELKPVTGMSSNQGRDPTKVDFPEGEMVMGVILGKVESRWVHKIDRETLYLCKGNSNGCKRCPPYGPKSTIQFKANFLTIDDTDKPVIKVIDRESYGFFKGIKEAFKEVLASGGQIETAVLGITRTGEGLKTKYAIENIAPKHKAFKDIAATIAPLTAHVLTFKPCKVDFEDTLSEPKDRSDIVEK